MSTTLADLKRRFNIDWTSILAGWQGVGSHRRLVTLPEVRQFAFEKLQAASESNPDLMELVNVLDTDTSRVDIYLANLASEEKADYEAAIRKWVVCLLEDKLRELPTDPLYGLIALTEFWSDMGFPPYSPHQVQGKGNNVSPQDYYTTENYTKALDQHKRWINKETREEIRVG